ncbi:MAG: hypothetical protein H0U69_00130, partial [Trueperaceae bacterium]|nr:hypothetical protein [Trueperaceae bacterium]
MDRSFLDATVLFSAAYRADAGVVRLWRLPVTTIHSSEYAVEEARRNLGETGQLDRFDVLMGDVQRVPAGTMNVASRQGVPLPEQDWPIVAGALAARATHLITGDLQNFGPHFGKQLFGVIVLSPPMYFRSRRDGTSDSSPDAIGRATAQGGSESLVARSANASGYALSTSFALPRGRLMLQAYIKGALGRAHYEIL